MMKQQEEHRRSRKVARWVKECLPHLVETHPLEEETARTGSQPFESPHGHVPRLEVVMLPHDPEFNVSPHPRQRGTPVEATLATREPDDTVRRPAASSSSSAYSSADESFQGEETPQPPRHDHRVTKGEEKEENLRAPIGPSSPPRLFRRTRAERAARNAAWAWTVPERSSARNDIVCEEQSACAPKSNSLRSVSSAPIFQVPCFFSNSSQPNAMAFIDRVALFLRAENYFDQEATDTEDMLINFVRENRARRRNRARVARHRARRADAPPRRARRQARQGRERAQEYEELVQQAVGPEGAAAVMRAAAPPRRRAPHRRQHAEEAREAPQPIEPEAREDIDEAIMPLHQDDVVEPAQNGAAQDDARKEAERRIDPVGHQEAQPDEAVAEQPPRDQYELPQFAQEARPLPWGPEGAFVRALEQDLPQELDDQNEHEMAVEHRWDLMQLLDEMPDMADAPAAVFQPYAAAMSPARPDDDAIIAAFGFDDQNALQPGEEFRAELLQPAEGQRPGLRMRIRRVSSPEQPRADAAVPEEDDTDAPER
ncbi:hypothetical protein QAD02_016914 [Eretmocerus hayati]|uniref:Uncharacterized protein n=1 Tax=Eretmocerus hayati TaxID=131215 RepID=A0ACC2PCT2_9HYME|nr:hypothetical protein QAD02_016914 [Eretmocerus hayati]